MDELLQYLKKITIYNESELEQILNKKIVITKNHVENIELHDFYEIMNLNIINLFEKYGYVFTSDDYISLVNKNGYILNHIPENMKTNEICKIAVEKNGYFLKFVPENNKTDEICEIAVGQTGIALQFVPDDKKTDNICKIAVKQNGWILEDVPENKKTDEICKIAIEQDKGALQFVPDNKKHLFIKK